MDKVTLTLPLPSRALNPNARPNRYAKAGAVKVHRNNARRVAYLAMREWDYPAGFVVFQLDTVAYWKRDSVRRDDVNLLASCKPYEDGIQDALKQDDRTWSLGKPEHHIDPEDPRLEIIIHIQAM